MFMENGLNGFLAKPIDTVKLNTILERWIPKGKRKISTSDNNNETGRETFKIKGLNTKKGITLTGGSIERYLETLSVFCDDGYEKIEELKVCLETGNIPLYTINVHALKSAAANIGAEELSGKAKALEMAGNQMDLDFIKENNPQFLTALESVLKDIGDSLSAYREERKKEGASLDMEVLKPILARLKLSLETMDARAMNSTMDTLLSQKLTEEAAAVIQNISRNVLIAEYDEALELTESLLKGLK